MSNIPYIGQPFHINDMNYDDMPYWEEFCKLQDSGKYEDGYEILYNNDVDFIYADILNQFYERLYNVQNYIENVYKMTPITAYKDKPIIKTKNMIFVSDKESI